MNTTKPIASLSLDLDNEWSYLKTHGDSQWKSFPSYLDLVVPRILDLLKERNLTITFFIVGQDAALAKNAEALAAIAAAGHEVGNHSFQHEPWLHLYSGEQIATDLATAEEHIERVTGRRPRGFRGPGFSLSKATVETLTRRGYLYDASTLPTFLGPVARTYYFMTAKLTTQERQQRKVLFGTLWDGLRPLSPYLWRTEAGELVEIPVTTMPIFKVPFHASYVLYLSAFSPALALGYFRTALGLCRLTGTQPSLLLHPLDFLGGDDVATLSFFPGMNIPSGKKMAIMDSLLEMFSTQFTVLTMQDHAQTVARSRNLRIRAARFHSPAGTSPTPAAVPASPRGRSASSSAE
jgi:hypothetical protein